MRTLLVEAIATIEKRDSPLDIIASFAAVFRIERADILSRSKWRVDVLARQLAMVFCTRFTQYSTTAIGDLFGRDHTCVTVARTNWDDLVDGVFAECRINAPRRPYKWRQRKPAPPMRRLVSYAGKEKTEEKLLREQLEDARAEVARLERLAASAACAEIGHDMKRLGGCNAACDEDCVCSVPVHECRRCGICDYGENEEAEEVRASCPYKDRS